MKKNAKIFLAGHSGLVGSALLRNLYAKGYTNIITRTRSELDLLDQNDVVAFFSAHKPEYVILAAAKVGGIHANNIQRGAFIYENLQIQVNVIHQAYIHGVKKLLFLGSSCIYPKDALQPMTEDCLLTSVLETSNEAYAIAKIAGLKMCEAYNLQYGTDFIALMPTNLYGDNDCYDLEKSHVLPALIRKMFLGKCLEDRNWGDVRTDLNFLPIDGVSGSGSDLEIQCILERHGIVKRNGVVTITLWGNGLSYREFMHVDDMADACVFLFEKVSAKDIQSLDANGSSLCFLNIGTGKDVTIKDLADLIKAKVGFNGKLVWDTSMPSGTFRKLLNIDKLRGLGWKETIDLEMGIGMVYENFIKMRSSFL